jgi:hypothetical protein
VANERGPVPDAPASPERQVPAQAPVARPCCLATAARHTAGGAQSPRPGRPGRPHSGRGRGPFWGSRPAPDPGRRAPEAPSQERAKERGGTSRGGRLPPGWLRGPPAEPRRLPTAWRGRGTRLFWVQVKLFSQARVRGGAAGRPSPLGPRGRNVRRVARVPLPTRGLTAVILALGSGASTLSGVWGATGGVTPAGPPAPEAAEFLPGTGAGWPPTRVDKASRNQRVNSMGRTSAPGVGGAFPGLLSPLGRALALRAPSLVAGRYNRRGAGVEVRSLGRCGRRAERRGTNSTRGLGPQRASECAEPGSSII